MAVRALDRGRKLKDVRLGVWEASWVHDDTWSKEEQVNKDENEPESAGDREQKEQSEGDDDGLDKLGCFAGSVLLAVLLPSINDG